MATPVTAGLRPALCRAKRASPALCASPYLRISLNRASDLYRSHFFVCRLWYTASMNILVVQVPVVDP
jgi:hypothetical protein